MAVLNGNTHNNQMHQKLMQQLEQLKFPFLVILPWEEY